MTTCPGATQEKGPKQPKVLPNTMPPSPAELKGYPTPPKTGKNAKSGWGRNRGTDA